MAVVNFRIFHQSDGGSIPLRVGGHKGVTDCGNRLFFQTRIAAKLRKYHANIGNNTQGGWP